jgi:putative membrane protein
MMRHLSIIAGLTILVAAWFGPLRELGQSFAQSAFAGHMAVHVAVVAVAAPLISAWLAADPRLMARMPRSLISPIPVSAFEFLVVWAWHAPMLHELARLSAAARVAEQASFLIAGILLWTSALRRGGGAGPGIIALLLTSMHMILLGTLLTLAPRPLYTHAISSIGDVYAHLSGQRVGGMLMLLGGGLPYLAGGLYLVHRLLRGPDSLRRTPGVSHTGNVP